MTRILIPLCTYGFHLIMTINKTDNVRAKATLRCGRVTIVAVEKQ